MQADAYQNYIAEAVRIIGENTARIAGGSYIKKRWDEIKDPSPKDTRTADEIISGIKKKLTKIGGE